MYKAWFLKSKRNACRLFLYLDHYGLTETMFDILYFVRENEDCTTQAQICNNLYLRKQTVNTALKKLEKEDYIYLEKDAGKRKNKTIHFTEKGTDLFCDKSGEKQKEISLLEKNTMFLEKMILI